MMLRHWVVVSLAVCVTAATSEENDITKTNDDQRRNDLLSMIRALQNLNSKIQKEALRRLSMQGSELIGVRSPMVSVDDATYAGTNEPAFVRGQRADVRQPLRFGKRESFRPPLRFGKREDDQMVPSKSQLQQGKRLSAVRNPLRFGKRADVRQPLRFGKRADVRQPLRFGKRLYSQPLD